MTNAIAWLAVFGVFTLLFWMVARDNQRKSARSSKEFERDVLSARGSMLKAGALGIEKLLSGGKEAAIEYVQDEDSGLTRTGGRADGKEPGEKQVKDGQR